MAPVAIPEEIRLLMERTADEDLSALDRLFSGASLRDGLDRILAELAQAAREEEGHSWADVGAVLNITKQAAQQRLGRTSVITVGLDGTVSTDQNRETYLAGLRAALEQVSRSGRKTEIRIIREAIREMEDDQSETTDAGKSKNAARERQSEVQPLVVEIAVERRQKTAKAPKSSSEAASRAKATAKAKDSPKGSTKSKERATSKSAPRQARTWDKS